MNEPVSGKALAAGASSDAANEPAATPRDLSEIDTEMAP